MDAKAARRSQSNADGEGVWSCPPDAGVKRAEMIRSRRRLTSPVLRGERAISRKTIAQGRPGRPGRTCMLVCVLFFCTRDRGCGQHPVFPAPSSLLEGRDFSTARAQIAPRECGLMSPQRLFDIHIGRLKRLGKPGLTQNSVRSMSARDADGHREVTLGNGTVPNLVTAAPLTHHRATRSPQQLA